ncbi:MAG: hypothetical protein K2Q20_13205 [Phycisphaerales bacterium]|nr:hypothetical protein [Phycisphaerales bacterium]
MSKPKANPTAKQPHPPSNRAAPEVLATIKLAKRVTDATGCPVVGGVAVALHGFRRYTGDIDIYSGNFWQTHEELEAAGMKWDSENREHVIEGVAIHMVGDDSLGGPPKRVSTIEGVKVIGLADLVRGKLTVGLEADRRAKDIYDVLELIRVVPLKKDFAGKLPSKLRAPFKKLVDDVHGPRRTTVQRLNIWRLK